VVALLLVAVSLGLSNFAAAIGIGVAGTRLRVGAVFGLFEAGMPVLGLLLGHGFASALGQAAHWIGAALLIATGTYGLIQAAHRPVGVSLQVADRRLGRLLVTGIALSIDNLAVGFALGTYHVSLVLAAANRAKATRVAPGSAA
jgi:putative Mn2+ efflux pump MntP